MWICVVGTGTMWGTSSTCGRYVWDDWIVNFNWASALISLWNPNADDEKLTCCLKECKNSFKSLFTGWPANQCQSATPLPLPRYVITWFSEPFFNESLTNTGNNNHIRVYKELYAVRVFLLLPRKHTHTFNCSWSMCVPEHSFILMNRFKMLLTCKMKRIYIM